MPHAQTEKVSGWPAVEVLGQVREAAVALDVYRHGMQTRAEQ